MEIPVLQFGTDHNRNRQTICWLTADISGSLHEGFKVHVHNLFGLLGGLSTISFRKLHREQRKSPRPQKPLLCIVNSQINFPFWKEYNKNNQLLIFTLCQSMFTTNTISCFEVAEILLPNFDFYFAYCYPTCAAVSPKKQRLKAVKGLLCLRRKKMGIPLSLKCCQEYYSTELDCK